MNYHEKDTFDSKIRRIIDNIGAQNRQAAKSALASAKTYFVAHADHNTDTYNQIISLLNDDLAVDVKYLDNDNAANCVKSIDKAIHFSLAVL